MEIEVFHDTVCPWCRLGKRHLQLALEDWAGEPVNVTYRSFFLNPDIPAEGYEFRPYMEAKGGGQIPLEGFFTAPRERGEAVGIAFNFEDIEFAPNTLLSHRLINYTPEAKREDMIERIYAAYFENGRNIGDLETLVEIATEAGMDTEKVRTFLESSEGEAAVMDDVALARQIGVSGVPFFVFNRKYAFSGAQPPEMIRQVVEQVAAEDGVGSAL